MNKIKLIFVLAFILVFGLYNISGQGTIPLLKKQNGVTEFIVNGKPFIMCAGELGNSSASTIESVVEIFPRLKVMNLNTILVPVYWELIEPEEDKFDFTLLQQTILEARKYGFKLVLLWFGSWKNSMSCYVPGWIKRDTNRFPRSKDENNINQEILTPFHRNNLIADCKAFEKLMSFIKSYDGKEKTVIMIQVENEIGMLPSARDYFPEANKLFNTNVPDDLIQYLVENKNNIAPELYSVWERNGFQTKGTWEDIFGKGLHTDEIFMAYYFAKYTHEVVMTGKKIYPLPMYVNAALNRPNALPGKGYPSAGPLPHVIDIWKIAAPSIDIFAPDIYFPDFKHWCDLYVRQQNPLFIPEHKFDQTVAPKALYAIGHYKAIGFSPFAIEQSQSPENEPIGKVYQLVNQLMPLIHKSRISQTIDAVMVDKMNPEQIVHFGNYELICKHDYTLGWAAEAKQEIWPLSGAIIIQNAPNEFFIAGTGVVVTFRWLINDTTRVGILKTEKGIFNGDLWKVILHLNGDETHQGRHIRIPVGNFEIQRFELYTY